MAILTKDKFRKRVIDLNGPEGNAFCLLGTAMSLCKQIGIGVERTDEILDEMRSDDYEHLIQTFDKYFENVCELDIMFNIEKAHFLLDEMVMNGRVIETNKNNVLKPIKLMEASEK